MLYHENMRVPVMHTAGIMIDSLLMQKAHLLLRYDDLQKLIMECGISPVFVSLYDTAQRDDMLTQWRIKLALLKMVNSLSKIGQNEVRSENMTALQDSVTDIMNFLAEDFLQINREFEEKLGNSAFSGFLQNHLQHHGKMIDDFIKHLTKIKLILTAS